MAAHVQTEANSGGATTTISVGPLTLTAGNAVYAFLITAGASTWTQSAGDTLSLIESNTGVSRLYYVCSVAGGSTTFTFDMDVNSFPTLFVSEFNAGVGMSCADAHTINTDSASSTPSSGTTTTVTQNDEIAYAGFHNTGTDTTLSGGPTNGFTVPSNGDRLTSVSSGERGLVAYKILHAGGTTQTALTTADARDWRNVISTFTATCGAAVTSWGALIAGRLNRLVL